MIRTRDEIEHYVEQEGKRLFAELVNATRKDSDRSAYRSERNNTQNDLIIGLLQVQLEVLLDCREFLSEHAIAHHLLKPELKAEIAEMIAGVTDDTASR